MKWEKETKRTVKTTPKITRPKLNVCWTARPAFSPVESRVQGTWPSSLKGVTDLLLELSCAVAYCRRDETRMTLAAVGGRALEAAVVMVAC